MPVPNAAANRPSPLPPPGPPGDNTGNADPTPPQTPRGPAPCTYPPRGNAEPGKWEGNGRPETRSCHPLLPPLVWRDYGERTPVNTPKDIVTRCPVVGAAASCAANATVVAAPDNALRDPARDVMPSGRPHCKNVCSNGRASPRTKRNNPAERTAAAQNRRYPGLGAGPRATPTRPLTPPRRLKLRTPHLPALLLVLMMRLRVTRLLPEVTSPARAVRSTFGPAAAPAGVPAAAALAPDASPARGRWLDTFGSTAPVANAEPPADRPCCNNVLAGTSARTAVHTPSKDNAAAGTPGAVRTAPAAVAHPLAAYRHVHENDSGPREPFTPADQVSERGVNFAPRRFVQPLLTAFHLWLYYDPNPAIHHARPGPTNSALLVPRQSAGD